MKLGKRIMNLIKEKKAAKYVGCGFLLLLLIVVLCVPNSIYGSDYTISSPNDLIAMANKSSFSEDDVYQLTADIDLTGYDFKGIGSEDNPFKGAFDGNGHTISGINMSSNQGAGLFVYAEGATIRNLKVKDANINTELKQNLSEVPIHAGYAGGIIGYASGCALYDCEVEDSTIGSNAKDITANIGEGLYVGGLVGVADVATVIEYCRVIDSQVSVNLSTEIAALDRTTIHNGGVVGSLRNESWIIDSFSSANLTTEVDMAMQTTVGVNNYFGGIAASMEGESCGITRCHYSGVQSGVKRNTGRGTEVALYNSGICGCVDDENAINISYTYYDYDKLLQGSGESADVVLTALRRESGANRGETETVKRIETEKYALEDSFATFDYLGSTEVDYTKIGSYSTATGVTLEKIKTALSTKGIRHVNKWIIDETAHMPVHGHSFGARLDFPGAGTVTIAETKNSDGNTLHSALKTESVNSSARQYTDADDDSTVTLTATVNDGYHFAGWYRTDNWYQNIPYTSLDGWKEMVTGNIPEGTTFEGTELTYAAPAEDDDFYLGHFQATVKFMPLGGTASSAPAVTAYYDYMDVMKDNSAYATAISKVKQEGIFAGWTTQEGGIESATLETLSSIKLYSQTTVVTETLTLYPVFIKDASSIVFTTIEAGTSDKDGNPNKVTCFGNEYGYNTRVLEQYDANKKYTASVDFEYDENQNLVCKLSIKDSDGNKITGDSDWETSGYRFLGWYRVEVDNRGAIVYDEETGKPNAARISREMETELPTETALSGLRLYEARFEYEVQYWAEYDKMEYVFHEGFEYAVDWYEYGENFVELAAPFHVQEVNMGWYTGIDGGLSVQKTTLDAYADNAKTGYEAAPFNGGGIALTSSYKITEPTFAFTDYEDNNSNFEVMTLSDFPTAAASLANSADTTALVSTATEKEGYHFWGWTVQRHNSNTPTVNQSSNFYEVSPENREAWKNDDYYWKGRFWSLLTRDYLVVAHFYADVDFVRKDGSKEEVYRRYLDELFLENDKSNVVYGILDVDSDATTYFGNDPDIDLNPDTVTAPSDGAHGNGIDDAYGCSSAQSAITIGASPSDADMAVPGYKFVGWIDAAEIGYVEGVAYEEQSYMYRYIYDNPDDAFVTTNADRAEGLLWRSTDDIQVTETMTLIPVYTYDFAVTVNSNISSLSSNLNSRIVRNSANNGFDIYLGTSAAINTYDYPFTGWYDENESLVTETLNDDVTDFCVLDDGDTGGEKRTFTFMANFMIRTTFHDSGDEYEDVEREHVVNKVIGTVISTLKPVETPENCYFIGWTTEEPGENSEWHFTAEEYYVIKNLDEYGLSQYEADDSKSGLENFLLTGEEIVQASMDIYPVYIHLDVISDNITVFSNMEDDTTTKLGLDASGLYLETAYAKDGYMLVDWKQSTDNVSWNFFTTLDEGATKYYISMPSLDKVLDTANDNQVINYYRADYGVKITYCGLTDDVLYSHGLLTGTCLTSTNADGKMEYYKEVPLDIISQYVKDFGERYGAICYGNRVYTKDDNGLKTMEAYIDTPITEPLTFYVDVNMIYAMDNEHQLCSTDSFKIGFSTDGELNAYLLEDYTLEKYAEFHIGRNVMEHGDSYPIGQNGVDVNLYLQKSTTEDIEYDLYQTSTTENHAGPVVEGYETTNSDGIAVFDIYGTIQIRMEEVEGYVNGETFMLNLQPGEGVDGAAMKIAIHPGETVTVTGLVFGDWKIEQDTNWSWRYDVVGAESINVNVDSVWADENDQVVFDNMRNDNLSFTDEEKYPE